jgi:hypothetical protein
MSGAERAAGLRAEAEQCLRLSATMHQEELRKRLEDIARELLATAMRLERNEARS